MALLGAQARGQPALLLAFQRDRHSTRSTESRSAISGGRIGFGYVLSEGARRYRLAPDEGVEVKVL